MIKLDPKPGLIISKTVSKWKYKIKTQIKEDLVHDYKIKRLEIWTLNSSVFPMMNHGIDLG